MRRAWARTEGFLYLPEAGEGAGGGFHAEVIKQERQRYLLSRWTPLYIQTLQASLYRVLGPLLSVRSRVKEFSVSAMSKELGRRAAENEANASIKANTQWTDQSLFPELHRTANHANVIGTKTKGKEDQQ